MTKRKHPYVKGFSSGQVRVLFLTSTVFHLSDEVSSPKWYKLITRVIRFHHFSETINLSGSNWIHNKEDKGYAPRKDS
ncbi:hypothetical protein GAX96_06995 [Phocaeicola vulgatus]|uniref:Uncharacterized protein n=1 Tax=Phocaeicola vulgatus TaxID=821 RepID=A0A6I1BLX3_PHOVU|nr:hypothetical protein GAX95_09450 [Phocaeicola vulgatus]KAB3558474.1 hypothetical protein GAY14_03870 [Phocaeicola vulgatus]KAB3560595.1 hypothetical protein GAY65_03870 [Phocaeicola vulgatus]KAB3567685.1 hypothetical protein GAX99_08970 [Phocaeicola vulgatus]KAB3570523.1 hypothetical protein GAX92_02200 [Phocaeicola vulgatus]